MASDWVRLSVNVDVSRYQNVLVHRDSESYKKFLHWKATGLDSDFGDLAEYISEDVASDMEFYIEDVEES